MISEGLIENYGDIMNVIAKASTQIYQKPSTRNNVFEPRYEKVKIILRANYRNEGNYAFDGYATNLSKPLLLIRSVGIK